MLCSEFKYVIHKHVWGPPAVTADETIHLFVNGASPKTSSLMSEVYEQQKSEDGFLT